MYILIQAIIDLSASWWRGIEPMAPRVKDQNLNHLGQTPDQIRKSY